MNNLISKVRPALVVFVFVALAFALLAARSQHSDDQIRDNQRKIAQVTDDRQKRIEARQVIDAKFCTDTKTAFDAIRALLIQNLKTLEAQHPTSHAQETLRQESIRANQGLLGKMNPIQCPPPAVPTP